MSEKWLLSGRDPFLGVFVEDEVEIHVCIGTDADVSGSEFIQDWVSLLEIFPADEAGLFQTSPWIGDEDVGICGQTSSGADEFFECHVGGDGGLKVISYGLSGEEGGDEGGGGKEDADDKDGVGVLVAATVAGEWP
jgi:hypothetical protein